MFKDKHFTYLLSLPWRFYFFQFFGQANKRKTNKQTDRPTPTHRQFPYVRKLQLQTLKIKWMQTINETCAIAWQLNGIWCIDCRLTGVGDDGSTISTIDFKQQTKLSSNLKNHVEFISISSQVANSMSFSVTFFVSICQQSKSSDWKQFKLNNEMQYTAKLSNVMMRRRTQQRKQRKYCNFSPFISHRTAHSRNKPIQHGFV